ncbi:MAG: hypothetical protein CSA15_12830 [Candidatus Delongbacteria bacterium]|nr:MAG: hypothetical protein CSA15_12830 [Candidatus Delongbacteria bacterium]
MKCESEIYSKLEFYCHYCKGFIDSFDEISTKVVVCPHCEREIQFSTRFIKYYNYIFKQNLKKTS